MTRQARLKSTSVGKGSPESFGVVGNLSGRRFNETQKYKDVERLIKNTTEDAHEWYSWSFYYDEQPSGKGSSVSSNASVFNRQGQMRGAAKDYAIPELIRRTIKELGGKFEAAYTRQLIDSDDPESGKYMTVVFVKWVPGPQVTPVDRLRKVRDNPQA